MIPWRKLGPVCVDSPLTVTFAAEVLLPQFLITKQGFTSGLSVEASILNIILDELAVNLNDWSFLRKPEDVAPLTALTGGGALNIFARFNKLEIFVVVDPYNTYGGVKS